MLKSFLLIAYPNVQLPTGVFDRDELSMRVSLADNAQTIVLGAFDFNLLHFKMYTFIIAVKHEIINLDTLSQHFTYTLHTTNASDSYSFLSFTLLDAFLFVTRKAGYDELTRVFSMWLTEMIEQLYPKVIDGYIKRPLSTGSTCFELVPLKK